MADWTANLMVSPADQLIKRQLESFNNGLVKFLSCVLFQFENYATTTLEKEMKQKICVLLYINSIRKETFRNQGRVCTLAAHFFCSVFSQHNFNLFHHP